MKNMDNLYDILQIDEKSRDIEIKKAYIKMLRKYPPEKCPEEFKKIREAYEILIDSVLKAEYNAFINHKDNIDDYRRKGNNALEKHQYRRAILYYKKILLIEPKLTFAKNKLGLAFFHDKQFEESIIQFRELIKLNPNNAIFYNNLAYVYKELQKYDVAEELLLKSYNIDYTNEKTVLVLAEIYIDTNDYEKGIKFIQDCLREKNLDSFNKILYYLKLIRIYVDVHDDNMVNESIDIIKGIVSQEDKVKEYVVWKLQKISRELLQDNRYVLGKNICTKLLQIDNNNDKLIGLLNKFKEILKVSNLLKEFQRDNRIIECLKKPIIDYLHWDTNNEKEFNRKKHKNLQDIKDYIEKDSLKVIKSIDILSNQYKEIYKYKEDLYKDTYNMAKDNKFNIKTMNQNYNEKKQWPELYETSKKNKRKFNIGKKYFKILISCIAISTIIGIIILKI